jgi:molybdopterin-guanine dinucleotide biosynthesis protein MobB
MIDELPIFGICGWSGSGKTTLIERIVPRLTEKGLKIVVVKHDAHGIDVDRPGKDSDRLYRSGADILLQGSHEEFVRRHRAEESDLLAVLVSLVDRYDLVLVEGHKTSTLRKVWLLGDKETAPPQDIKNIAAVLPRDSDRLAAVMPLLEKFLTKQWLKTPVSGCVLIGGKSTRMGTPKHLLRKNRRTWLARTVKLLEQVSESVVIVGSGEVPEEVSSFTRLADVLDAKGPLSGVLAAMRWAPHASWLIVACDLPDLSADALSWILSTREPGIWATLPRLEGSCGLEPLLAHYDFRARVAMQRQAIDGNFRPADIALHARVISPEVPAPLTAAWRNVNIAADLKSETVT